MQDIVIKKSREADLSIAVYTNETPEVLRLFVKMHLLLGAAKIFMFVDNPGNAFIEEARAIPQIDLHVCDAAYWSEVGIDGERPYSVEGRQMLSYKLAYEKAETTWIAFCDSDEFFVANRDLADVLDDAPEDALVLRGAVWEACWGARTAFNDPFSANIAKRGIWGKEAQSEFLKINPVAELISNGGIMGHTMGKVIVRTGLEGIKVGVHDAHQLVPGQEDEFAKLTEATEFSEAELLTLLRYDAICFSDWQRKHGSNLDGTTKMVAMNIFRKSQTSIFSFLDSEASQERFFRSLYVHQPGYLHKLLDNGYARHIRVAWGELE